MRGGLRVVRRRARRERCASGLVSAWAGAPPSSVKITCPTLIFSPSLTLMSLTMPLTDDGTSTTALSVSSSMTGWPSETLVPGAIIRRTRSPWEMFSPSSGSLNSLGPVGSCNGSWSGGSRRRGRRHRGTGFCGTGAGAGAGVAAGSWSGGRRRGFGLSAVDGEDDLADFDLVALFDFDFLHGSAHRRRHLDDGLVGFKFHDRLTSADGGSGRNHEAHEVALFDVFSQLGKFEFDHRVGPFLGS